MKTLFDDCYRYCKIDRIKYRYLDGVLEYNPGHGWYNLMPYTSSLFESLMACHGVSEVFDENAL